MSLLSSAKKWNGSRKVGSIRKDDSASVSSQTVKERKKYLKELEDSSKIWCCGRQLQLGPYDWDACFYYDLMPKHSRYQEQNSLKEPEDSWEEENFNFHSFSFSVSEYSSGALKGLKTLRDEYLPPKQWEEGDSQDIFSVTSLLSNATLVPIKEYFYGDDDKKLLECDFDENPTDLFICLQLKKWEAALAILKETPYEAKTWVFRREQDGELRWRLLPLHAAIIFDAPDSLVEAIFSACPRAARAKDDQGMLPLHLSCRTGRSETIMSLFLKEYPDALQVIDYEGRTPLFLAETSGKANHYAFLRAIQGQQASLRQKTKYEAKLRQCKEEKNRQLIQAQKQAEFKQAVLEEDVSALQAVLGEAQKRKEEQEQLEEAHKHTEEQRKQLIVELEEAQIELGKLREQIKALEVAKAAWEDERKNLRSCLRAAVTQCAAAADQQLQIEFSKQHLILEKLFQAALMEKDEDWQDNMLQVILEAKTSRCGSVSQAVLGLELLTVADDVDSFVDVVLKKLHVSPKGAFAVGKDDAKDAISTSIHAVTEKKISTRTLEIVAETEAEATLIDVNTSEAAAVIPVATSIEMEADPEEEAALEGQATEELCSAPRTVEAVVAMINEANEKRKFTTTAVPDVIVHATSVEMETSVEAKPEEAVVVEDASLEEAITVEDAKPVAVAGNEANAVVETISETEKTTVVNQVIIAPASVEVVFNAEKTTAITQVCERDGIENDATSVATEGFDVIERLREVETFNE